MRKKRHAKGRNSRENKREREGDMHTTDDHWKVREYVQVFTCTFSCFVSLVMRCTMLMIDDRYHVDSQADH